MTYLRTLWSSFTRLLLWMLQPILRPLYRWQVKQAWKKRWAQWWLPGTLLKFSDRDYRVHMDGSFRLALTRRNLENPVIRKRMERR